MVAKQTGQAAGGFFGALANNPGIVAIAGIAITVVTTLLIFRKDIANFFSGFGQVELPDITFPSLPDITFPTFEFPSFPDITFPTFEFPTFEFPDFNIEFPTFEFPDIFGGGGGGDPDLPPGFQPNPEFEDDPTMFLPPDPVEDIPGVTVTETETETGTLFSVEIGGQPEPEPDPDLDILSGFAFTPFTTLSDIINQFGVSASAAANLLAEALGNFGGFAFGTNVNPDIDLQQAGA